MHTWKTHLLATLRRLAKSHANSPLAEVERLLAGVFEAETVRLRDCEGHALPEDTTLDDLLAQPFTATVFVECLSAAQPSPERPSRFHPDEAPPQLTDMASDPRFEHFVTDFVRLEESHEFMWAGYIVRDLLPRLGFPAQEAKLILDHMRADGMLTITKVPNPKNPVFPATGVQLNREHPSVRAILERCAAPPPSTDEAAAPSEPISTEEPPA